MKHQMTDRITGFLALLVFCAIVAGCAFCDHGKCPAFPVPLPGQ